MVADNGSDGEYLIFVMRADNQGEGGILSLLAPNSRLLAHHTVGAHRVGCLTIAKPYRSTQCAQWDFETSRVARSPDWDRGLVVLGLLCRSIQLGHCVSTRAPFAIRKAFRTLPPINETNTSLR